MNDCDGEKDLHLDGGACTNLVDGGSRLTWHPVGRRYYAINGDDAYAFNFTKVSSLATENVGTLTQTNSQCY